MDNRVATALENLVLHVVQKVSLCPEFIFQISDGVIDSPGYIKPVVALVRFKQQKLLAEQVRIED